MTCLEERSRIIVFGAGNIGLSFVGQIFHRAGYRVTFADTAAEVLQRLAEYNGYSVRMLSPDGSEETIDVYDVETIDARDAGALSRLLVQRPLIATAVGARAFPIVLQSIRSAIDHDRSNMCPSFTELDIIAAENIHDPRSIAEAVYEHERPGVHGCSVGKMVPIQEKSQTGPIVVRAESFNTLITDGTDWRNPRPDDVEWITFVRDIRAWTDRKLFVHNLGHAACAWRARAYDPDIATIAEAIAVPAIRGHVESVMRATAAIVCATYPHEFNQISLSQHVTDLLHRFGNPNLGDTIERVGQDLQRKLGREERLLGAMLLAAKTPIDSTRIGATLRILSEVAHDAATFGMPGFSRNTGDIALFHRQQNVAAIITELGPLNPQNVADNRVIGALETHARYTA